MNKDNVFSVVDITCTILLRIDTFSLDRKDGFTIIRVVLLRNKDEGSGQVSERTPTRLVH